MMRRICWILLVVALPCWSAAPSSVVERQLVAAKAQLMSADYRADLVRLARVRAQLAPLRDDPKWTYLVDYWAGFASWRVAINGVSKNMPKQDLKANLDDALADFEAAVTLRPDFADAASAASSVHAWLGNGFTDDREVAREHYHRATELLERALQSAPDNPRVLWVQGGSYLFKPAAFGGDPARAEKIYAQQVQVAPPVDAHSPLPDWGKAEGWMSLAFAHLNRPEPDLVAARKEADAALGLQPDWHYVRDILVPQIDAAIAPKASTPR
jgi:tetratricopeptide (TPR) repeat protein